MTTMENDLPTLKERYQTSPFKDDQRVMSLVDFDFCALLFQLQTCHFEVVPFSNVSFIRYMLIGMDRPQEILDFVFNIKGRITLQNFILN